MNYNMKTEDNLHASIHSCIHPFIHPTCLEQLSNFADSDSPAPDHRFPHRFPGRRFLHVTFVEQTRRLSLTTRPTTLYSTRSTVLEFLRYFLMRDSTSSDQLSAYGEHGARLPIYDDVSIGPPAPYELQRSQHDVDKNSRPRKSAAPRLPPPQNRSRTWSLPQPISQLSNFAIQYNLNSASIAFLVMKSHNDDLTDDDSKQADYPPPAWAEKTMLAAVFAGTLVGEGTG